MISKILNTGVSAGNLDSLNGRIKLNNFIAVFILLVSILTLPLYVYLSLPLLTLSTAGIVLISLASIYLQSIKNTF